MRTPLPLPLLLLVLLATPRLAAIVAQEKPDSPMKNMVTIKAGTFQMGDVFGDGAGNERPVHEVTVDAFCLSRHEVTVGEFHAFARDTGYTTSAETFRNREAQEQRLARIKVIIEENRGLNAEAIELIAAVQTDGGCSCWRSDVRTWDFDVNMNWRNPGFQQTDRDPVVGVSWNDAASYCNWLSAQEGLPHAYDVETGQLVDEIGQPTNDLKKVKGYRLPSEAEWEFAARQRGEEVRFGNGKNVAKSAEINFDAGSGNAAHDDQMEGRNGTVPVGSFAPNTLGLHDMSGNAWEWCGDSFSRYAAESPQDPHESSHRVHALRGGRWGGSATEARVFHRVGYGANDRCNNSGFRIARSRQQVIRRSL